MHMRRRKAKIATAPADKAAVGFLTESVRKQRWADLKAEAAEHKFCILLTAYLAGLIAIAQTLLLVWPAAGAVATVVALLGSVVLAYHSRKARVVAIAASIPHVAVMASLALPQHAALTQAGILYGTLLFLTAAYRLTLPEAKTKQKGPDRKTILRCAPLAILVGVLVGALGYGMLRNELVFGSTNLPVVAAALAGFAIVEELYFRDFLQKYMRKAVGPMLSGLLVVTTYTAMTLPFGSIGFTAFAAISSSALSYTYYSKPNLAMAIATNLAIKLTFVGLLAAAI